LHLLPARPGAGARHMAVVSDPTVPGLDRYWPPFRTAAIALSMEALKNRFPTLAPLDIWIEAGCLLSYTPDMPLPDRFRRTAIYVGKILKRRKTRRPARRAADQVRAGDHP